MRTIGYARVSTLDQDTGVQREALEAAGCDLILEEKVSGTSRDGREQLELALKLLCEGDVLVAYKLDRLARSLKDLLDIVDEVKSRKAHIKVLDAPWLDGSIHGDLMMNILGSFAQFETALRRDRQMAGIRKAKRDNPEKYRGRPQTVPNATIITMHTQGAKVSDICRHLGVSRSSVYRAIAAQS